MRSRAALLAAWEGPRGTREQLQCVVDALDERAGGTHQTGALERHSDEAGTRVECILLLMELRSGNEREKLSQKARYSEMGHPLRLAMNSLAPGGSSYPDDQLGYLGALSATDLFTHPKQIVFDIPQAIMVDAFRDSSAASGQRGLLGPATFGTRRAALRSFLGDEAGALAALDELDAKLLPFSHRSYTDEQKQEWDSRTWRIANDDYDKQRVLRAAEETRLRQTYDPDKDAAERIAEGLVRTSKSVRAAVLLRAGKTAEARVLADAQGTTTWQPGRNDSLFRTFLNARSTHDPQAQETLARGDGRESNRKLWLAAQTGDGQALAARLREQNGDGRGIVEIVGAHLPEGRADLAHWVRFEYPAPCTTCGLYPLMNYLGSRYDAARATSDEATTQDLIGLRTRLDPILARRDIALVLHFLSELSPP